MVSLEDIAKYKYLQILKRGNDDKFHLYPAKIIYYNKTYLYFKYTGNEELLERTNINNIWSNVIAAVNFVVSTNYSFCYFLEPPASTLEINKLNQFIEEKVIQRKLFDKYSLLKTDIGHFYKKIKNFLEYAEEHPKHFKKCQEKEFISDEEIEFYKYIMENTEKLIYNKPHVTYGKGE